MRKLIKLNVIVCSALVLTGIGGRVAFADDPLAESTDTDHPVLPDPLPDNGKHFAPGLATAGTADPGPTLNSTPASALTMTGRESGCSVLNPCAMNSPPLGALTPVAASPDDKAAAQQARHPHRHGRPDAQKQAATTGD